MTMYTYEPKLVTPGEALNTSFCRIKRHGENGPEVLRVPLWPDSDENETLELARSLTEQLNKAGTLDAGTEADTFAKLLGHRGHKLRLDWHDYNGETYGIDIICVTCQDSLFTFYKPWVSKTRKTRFVEMYYGDNETKSWDTIEIEIPADTPDNRIKDMADQAMLREMQKRNIAAAFWGVRHIEEMEWEDENDGEEDAEG